MANKPPVINSVTVTPQVIGPGGKATVTVLASDPDDKVFKGKVKVSNTDGATGPEMAVEFKRQDTITYECTFDDPAVQVVQTSPGVFECTAP